LYCQKFPNIQLEAVDSWFLSLSDLNQVGDGDMHLRSFESLKKRFPKKIHWTPILQKLLSHAQFCNYFTADATIGIGTNAH